MTSDATPDFEAPVVDVRLFPLSRVTLFPGVRLPFHIFEPRYRDLLAHALDADGLVAIPQAVPAPGGSAIAAVFGVGEITRWVTHSDGTSDIEVTGRFRARFVEEIPCEAGYRMAKVRRLEEETPDAAAAREIADDLRQRLRALDRWGVSESARDVVDGMFEKAESGPTLDVGFLVNILATVVIGDAGVRQALLEESSVAERARHLGTILDTLRQELGGRSDPSEG